MVTDTISDILTRIRNANMVRHQIVKLPCTKIALEIIKILKDEGFIRDFIPYTENNHNYILVSLKYIGKYRRPVISKLERISKPGLRIYANTKTLPIVLNNLGIAILSTSKGVMTNIKAKQLGTGGEILCYIW